MLALLLTQFTHTFLIRVRACVSVCVDNIWNSSVTHHCHCNCTVYTSCVVNSLQTHTHTHTYKCTYNDFMPDLKDSKETFCDNYKTRHLSLLSSMDFHMEKTSICLWLYSLSMLRSTGDCSILLLSMCPFLLSLLPIHWLTHASHTCSLLYLNILWSNRHFSEKITRNGCILFCSFIW